MSALSSPLKMAYSLSYMQTLEEHFPLLAQAGLPNSKDFSLCRSVTGNADTTPGVSRKNTFSFF